LEVWSEGAEQRSREGLFTLDEVAREGR
jgi:hypothetical protein